MNYIWEKAIQKKECFYRQSDVYSPYYEQTDACINEETNEETITFNSLYRFDDIFSLLFIEKDLEKTQWRDELFNMLVRFIVSHEILRGFSKREYLVRLLKERILAGDYGTDVKKLYEGIGCDKQDKIARYFLDQYDTGNSIYLFSKVMVNILGKGVVYSSELEKKELLCYVGVEKNNQDAALIQLIEMIFLPFDYKVRIFWDNHFGVVGAQETMVWDNIEIF